MSTLPQNTFAGRLGVVISITDAALTATGIDMNKLNEDVRKFNTQDTIGAIIGYPFYLLLIYLYYLYYTGDIDLGFMYYIASWYLVFWYSIDLCSGLYFKRFLQVLAPIYYDYNMVAYFWRVFFNIVVVAWSLFVVLYLY